jgi:hypothetical protein
MSFTTDELTLVNQALGRIGTTSISSTENGLTTCNNYVKAYLHYGQTRDSLLRSFEWNFAIGQAELALISDLVLDTQPTPDNWVVGDTITGITSFESAEILTVISGTEYEIIYKTGTFTDAEKITNATVEQVYWEGLECLWEGENVLWYSNVGSDETDCGVGYPIVTAITPTYHYSHQYELPEDYERLTKRWKHHHHWTIQGNRLLTSEDTVSIEYVKRITDPTLFDSMFTEVLILQLALKLLAPLAGTQTTSFRQGLQIELKDAMSKARTVCSAEINNTGYSDWNLARYGTGKIRTHL